MNITPELGCCYYPEHWPEDQWASDAARMKDMGLSWVRIGEFSWSVLEPKPESLQWEWLDRAVETLHQAGLKIVMGTPTATPPRWMIDKWPDMLAVDEQGQPRKFGSRRHYCFSHEGYKEESARITRLMAARYGQHPAVVAWQTDNEYGCHDTIISYSDPARVAFQGWLKNRYETIEALNNAWGNRFWSMDYAAFSDVDLPNLTVTEPNPSHVLDFKRFSSDQVVVFNKIQADILREYTDAPLIHNYMGRIVEFDHYKVGDDLDIASWDSYPLGFLEDRSDEGDEWKRKFARQGDPDFQALHHDLYRAVGKGRWWVMEQQPGPVNWAPFNPAPLPNMVRLWTLEAMAHGAEAVLYFRWRQAPFAQEQMHAGLLRPDSKDAFAAGEARQVAEDLKELGPLTHESADVALMFDYESAWAWQVQPQGASFDYFRLILDQYRALRKLGLNVDIVSPYQSDLSAYKMVVIGGLFAWSDQLRSTLADYKGVLLAGPRTGSKTQDFQIPAGLAPDMQDMGLDVTIPYVETIREDCPRAIEGGGSIAHWLDAVETTEPVLMSLEEGSPLLMGKDNRFYLAGYPNGEGMMSVFNLMCEKAGIEIEVMPDYLRKRKTKSVTFLFNYSDEPVEYQGQVIPAAGVSWV